MVSKENNYLSLRGYYFIVLYIVYSYTPHKKASNENFWTQLCFNLEVLNSWRNQRLIHNNGFFLLLRLKTYLPCLCIPPQTCICTHTANRNTVKILTELTHTATACCAYPKPNKHPVKCWAKYIRIVFQAFYFENKFIFMLLFSVAISFLSIPPYPT